MTRATTPIALASAVAAAAIGVGLVGLLRPKPRPIGNPAVPEPAKPVDLKRYAGVWYELGRYDAWFEKGLEGSSAEYRALPDGSIEVINRARCGGLDGPVKMVKGRAKVKAGSGDAKLKVSFFGPFFIGDYWVLDRADDYSWSIVGEPSGRFLWLLCRQANPAADVAATVMNRAQALGYDLSLLHRTLQ
jgi:apolipoprotein D and lipocalin family protein